MAKDMRVSGIDFGTVPPTIVSGTMKLKNGSEIFFIDSVGQHEVFTSAGGEFIAWPDDDEDEDDDDDFPPWDDDDDDEEDEDDGFGGAQPDAVYFDEAVALGAKPEMNHVFDSAAYNRAFEQSVIRAGRERLDRECAEIINKAFDNAVNTMLEPWKKLAEEECRKAGIDVGVAMGGSGYPAGKNCKVCQGWVPFGESCKTCPPVGSKPCPVAHRKGAGCPVCDGKGWVME